MVVYTGSLLLILMYALAQLNLLINYLSAKKKTTHCPVFDFENPEEIKLVKAPGSTLVLVDDDI